MDSTIRIKELETTIKALDIFRSTVESSPMATCFFRLDDEDRLIFTGCNPAAKRILGISPDSLAGMPAEETMPGFSQTQAPDMFRAVARGTEGPRQFDIGFDNGLDSRWYDIHVFQTGPGAIAANFMDVTHRKQVENALRESEENVTRLSNQTEQLSMAAASMISIREKQVVFDEISRAIVEHSDFSRVLISLFKETHPFREIIGFGGIDGATIDRLRGVEMPMSWYDKVFELGKKIGHFSYYIPHTLKHILNQNATVYGHGPDSGSSGTWHPEDNLFVRMNDQDGRCIGIISVDNSKSGKIPSDEAVRPLEIFASLISQIIILRREQEERAKIEEKLHQAKRIESIGVLAGGIAHDFNNILMGLFGNLSMAKLELSVGHPAYDLLDRAEASLETARSLTGQLLTFAKGGEPVKQTFTLEDVVRQTAEFNLSGSNVRMHLESIPGLWPINADLDQISQVVSNLVINARQSMPGGGRIQIRLTNEPLADENGTGLPGGNYLKLCFEDQGIGISASHLERVFEPYFTTKKDGSGLGMAIVHSIIKKHKGHISIRSEAGSGTAVTVYLPATDLEPEALHRESRENFRDEPDGMPLKILVMDDDEIVRSVTELMLTKLGYSVSLVVDGQACIDSYTRALADGSPYDVVIMDLTVPGGMGGKEAILEILHVDTHARVIVASGYSTDPVMANYRDYGFSGVATKPYKIDQLQAELRKVVRCDR